MGRRHEAHEGIVRVKDEFTRVPLDAIEARQGQVRETFVGIKQLAENIRQRGLLQNLVVEAKADRYVILAGERRYRALLELQKNKTLPAGWTAWTVPVCVRKPVELEVEWIGISENIQRADVYPWEMGKKLYALSRVATLDELAGHVGKLRPWVKRCIAIHRGLHPESIARILKLGIEQFRPSDITGLAVLTDELGEPDGPRQLKLIERLCTLKTEEKKIQAPRPTLLRRFKALSEANIPERHERVVRHVQAWLSGKIDKLRLEEFE